MLKTKKNQLILILFLAILFLTILGINTKVSAAKYLTRTFFVNPGQTITIPVPTKKTSNPNDANVYTTKKLSKKEVTSDAVFYPQSGKIKVSKNAALKKSYYVVYYKGINTEYAEIYIMPKYTLKLKDSDNTTIKRGDKAKISIYCGNYKTSISEISFSNKIMNSHIENETVAENVHTPKGSTRPTANIVNKKKTVIDQKRTSTVTFSSDNPDAVSVDPKTGELTAKIAGQSANITMTRTIIDEHPQLSGTAKSVLTASIKVQVKEEKYKFIYNANGGSGEPKSVDIVAGQDLTISTQQPTRKNCKFLGWSIYSDSSYAISSQDYYKPGEVVQVDYRISGNIRVYAVWQENSTPKKTKTEQCTLTYDANNGSGGPSSKTVASGTNVTISSTKPKRSGYTFLGWATSSDAKSATYTSGSKINITKNITLYAVWQKINDSNKPSNGSGGTTSLDKIYTNNLKVGNKLQIKNGYSWWTYTKHTGTSLSSGVKYRALLGNDKVEIKQIDGNWLKVKIVSLSNKTSKNNYKVGDIYYIYYGSTASKYITTIK